MVGIHGKKLIHSHEEKTKPVHWLLFFVSVIFYIAFNAVIIYLSGLRQDMAFAHINKFTLNGLLAQGQVIAVILLTLNPLRGSQYTALVLCGATSIAAFINVFVGVGTEALPGVFVPAISGVISIIIKHYSNKLKKQLNRVVDYSKIVKRNEEMLHSLAYYDALTGLPNKKTMMDQTEMLQKKGDVFYLVYIDVDDLKTITDTLGRSIGDAVLQNVAQRLKQYCRHEDIITRVGFSEFVVLMCRETNPEQIQSYLDGYQDTLKEPIRIGHKEFHICVRFGVAKYPADGVSAEELLKNADHALIKAKIRHNRQCQFFSDTLKQDITRRNRLESDLFSAISNQELFVEYQPQYCCKTAKLRGFEALLRWNHPELGSINPAEFIPMAEAVGLMPQIGRWVITSVLEMFMGLQNNEKIETVVSVNISIKQLLDPAFESFICGILKKTGFEGKNLEFDISESAAAVCPEYMSAALLRLKAMGIGIALDNFAKRYASLSDLQKLPFNVLKIDKTVIDKAHSPHQMTQAVITMAHTLGIRVVAVGVEQPEQMAYLTANQCDYAQGYCLCRPHAEEQIARVYSGELASLSQ